MTKPRVTAERLREVLDYEADTGLFIWKVALSRIVAVGSVAGTIVGDGYRHIGIDGVYYGAHRLAWLHVHGDWPNGEVDHVNLDRSDNRISNLRLATNQTQSANRRVLKNNRLGIKGVGISTWRVRKPQRYRARIRVRDKLIHLGYFSTPEAASEAYAAAAKKHFGEFARPA